MTLGYGSKKYEAPFGEYLNNVTYFAVGLANNQLNHLCPLCHILTTVSSKTFKVQASRWQKETIGANFARR